MIAQSQTFNPWLTIWTQPRATIRQIVKHNPDYQVIVLGALLGMAQALDRAAARNAGDSLGLPMILLLCLIGGPIGGLVFLYLGGALLQWIGRWLGGLATMAEVRAALAWSSVPNIFGLAIWLPALALLGSDLFTATAPRVAAQPLLALVLLALAAIKLFLGVWSTLLTLWCLSEVQQFSVWRALGSVLLAGLILIVPFVVLAALVGMIA
jgi:hypothetical protein